jgi:hypothetical protein
MAKMPSDNQAAPVQETISSLKSTGLAPTAGRCRPTCRKDRIATSRPMEFIG